LQKSKNFFILKYCGAHQNTGTLRAANGYNIIRVSSLAFGGNDIYGTTMFNLFAGSYMAAIKLLSILSVSKAGLAVGLMLWHQAVYGNGFYRFCHLAHALPFLTLELRIRLNLHYWVKRLWQFARHCQGRSLLPSVPSIEFLRRRDGHTIFDFFKTLSFSGISPPAFA
jgi:hypothetical protein